MSTTINVAEKNHRQETKQTHLPHWTSMARIDDSNAATHAKEAFEKLLLKVLTYIV